MRYLYLILVGSFIVFGFPNHVLAIESSKIGIVNMQKLQEKSIFFQKTKEELKQKFQALQEKLNKEKEELIKVEEDLKKQSMMLSLDAKQDKQKELRKKSRHYKYLFDEYTQEMKEAEMEATKKFGKELAKIVEKIGKKKGYTLILERKGIGLIYYNDAVDITDEVVRAFDQHKQ